MFHFGFEYSLFFFLLLFYGLDYLHRILFRMILARQQELWEYWVSFNGPWKMEKWTKNCWFIPINFCRSSCRPGKREFLMTASGFSWFLFVPFVTAFILTVFLLFVLCFFVCEVNNEIFKWSNWSSEPGKQRNISANNTSNIKQGEPEKKWLKCLKCFIVKLLIMNSISRDKEKRQTICLITLTSLGASEGAFWWAFYGNALW